MIRMDTYSAVGVVFSRPMDNRTIEPTYLPFGYSLSGVIWLFPELRSLFSTLDCVHPFISAP